MTASNQLICFPASGSFSMVGSMLCCGIDERQHLAGACTTSLQTGPLLTAIVLKLLRCRWCQQYACAISTGVSNYGTGDPQYDPCDTFFFNYKNNPNTKFPRRTHSRWPSMTAIRFSRGTCRRWFNIVVFLAPNNPVRVVTGTCRHVMSRQDTSTVKRRHII